LIESNSIKLIHSNTIKGLIYIKDFITDAEEKQLFLEINKNDWSNKISRRT